MDYERFFADAIGDLKAEGNYRVFADLERLHGTGFTSSWVANEAMLSRLGSPLPKSKAEVKVPTTFFLKLTKSFKHWILNGANFRSVIY